MKGEIATIFLTRPQKACACEARRRRPDEPVVVWVCRGKTDRCSAVRPACTRPQSRERIALFRSAPPPFSSTSASARRIEPILTRSPVASAPNAAEIACSPTSKFSCSRATVCAPAARRSFDTRSLNTVCRNRGLAITAKPMVPVGLRRVGRPSRTRMPNQRAQEATDGHQVAIDYWLDGGAPMPHAYC